MSTRQAFALAAFAILFLCILSSLLSPSTPSNSASTPRPAAAPTATPTLQGRILAAIGQTDRAGAERPVIQIDAETLRVVFSMDDGLTASSMRRATLATAVAIARVVRDHSDNTRELRIGVSGPITDAYGNTTEQHVLSVYLKPATLDKINFDAFDIDNLPAIADHYWQHQALPD